YKRSDEGLNELPTLNAAAKQLLKEHQYSGNIRELRSILLRALFFRKGRVINVDDIRRALPTTPIRRCTSQTAVLTEQVAREIYNVIVSGDNDFWTALYIPYTNNTISRDVVSGVIDIARERGANNMPQIATMLRACDSQSDDDKERKTFYKFKNFLYKTIRIT
ncbi:MAG: Fis family transcriptional regulator, partial [Deltaproteobacteria bacterium]|nr:Fis family transcriptional regulator [Deltaproteobacteria bacterium]